MFPHKCDTIPTMFFDHPASSCIRAGQAGWFVSRGHGAHPTRVIDSWELIHVLRGSLHLFEEHNDYQLQCGDALLLEPGKRHGAASPYTPDCSFHWVHFHTNGLALRENAPRHTRVQRPERLTALFRHYMNDQETGDLDPHQGSLLIQLMLAEASRPSPAAADSSSAATLARLARQYVLQNLDTQLTTSHIAFSLGCNPDYLGRCFRDTYRETITEAIQGERLRRARSLLLENRDSVEQVARTCGFQSTAFFRRVFRRAQGMSPTRFRAIHARVLLNTE
jgi:AraC-like DNA-binding protein